MTEPLRRAAGALALACLCGIANASVQEQAPGGNEQATTALRGVLDPAGPGGRWAPSRARLAQLRELEAVRLEEIDLPGLPASTLVLDRLHAAADNGVLRIDGVEVANLNQVGNAARSTWTGSVDGHPDSRVFLSFAPEGVRGWVHLNGRTIHALPDQSSSADVRPSRFVDQAVVQHLAPARDTSCDASCAPVANPALAEGSQGYAPTASAAPAAGSPIYRIELVLETDYRYFQNFGNSTEAAQYALDLAAAASATYTADAGIALEVTALNLHTHSADPWNGTTPDDLLGEMRSAWIGGLKQQGDAGMILSGHPGGGLAYVDTLCGNYAVGACNGIRGNSTFPVAQSPMNWDFVVFCHELGHIVASPHTHDYCPPIDQCAPTGYQGNCQSQQVCEQSTLMSYCHLCPGGVNNIQPGFHPSVAAVLRAGAASANCVDTLDAPPGVPPTIANASPSWVPVVVTDLATVTLTGDNFTEATEVRWDGVTLGQLPPMWTVVDDQTIQVRLPHTGGIGQHTLQVITPHGSASTSITRIVNLEPALDLVQSDPEPLVLTDGADFHVGAWPGHTVFLFVSAVRAPSVLPGLVNFEIGASFTSWHSLGAHQVAWGTGQVEVHMPLPPGLPAGFQMHSQAAVLSNTAPQFPVPVTEVQTGTVLF